MFMPQSLKQRGQDEYDAIMAAFQKKHPAPESNKTAMGGKWVLDDGKLKLRNKDGNAPASFQCAPMAMFGFFDYTQASVDPGTRARIPARLKLNMKMVLPRSPESDADTEAKFTADQDLFFQAIVANFAPGKSLAHAIQKNFNAMTGKQKPSGVTQKNLFDLIVADQKAPKEMRPRFTPVPLKIRESEDGEPIYEFGFTMYLSEPTSNVRKENVLPKEIESAYAAVHGDDIPIEDPVVDFFRREPDVAPVQNLAMTTPGKIVNPFQILAAATKKGKSIHYVRLCASVLLGGATVRYNVQRKLFTFSLYANRPLGVRVWAIPAIGPGTDDNCGENEEDDEVYNAIGGGGKEVTSPTDESVYELVSEPYKRSGEDGGGAAEPPAKRSKKE